MHTANGYPKRGGDLKFEWLDAFAIWFSLIFALLFVANYLLNPLSDPTTNYYRFLYGLVPCLAPLLVSYVPFSGEFGRKNLSLILIGCIVWIGYLIARGDSANAYYGLTAIALTTPIVVLFLYQIFAKNFSAEEVPRRSECPPGNRDLVLMSLIVFGLFYLSYIAKSGGYFFWLLSTLLSFMAAGIYFHFKKARHGQTAGARNLMAIVLVVACLLIFIWLNNLTKNYQFMYGDYVGYENAGNTYQHDKKSFSPNILIFYGDYFINGSLAGMLQRSTWLLPTDGLSDFTRGGDFGWNEYINEFGVIGIVALILNFHLFLRRQYNCYAYESTIKFYLWGTLLILNGHYGIFYTATGVVSYILMIIGLKMVSAIFCALSDVPCRKLIDF